MTAPTADEDGFGPSDVGRLIGTPIEVTQSIQDYLSFLADWNTRLNLIGPAEHRHMWRRHVLDCLQLINDLRPQDRSLVDIGSGAGLPGVILALAAPSSLHVSLVEKSPKKSEFLEAVIRHLGLNARVLNHRLEDVRIPSVDVVTARALAPLPKLFGYAEPLIHPNSLCLFLKGREAENELTKARESWTFQLSARPSLSSSEGQVLAISSLARRPR